MIRHMKIYNTLTREKEEFIPLENNKVRMFVCGPTVYDFSHLGHARCYVAFDVAAKYFRYKGFKVRYIQNITDIDDKIINKANQIGKGFKEVSEEFEKYYHEDMEALGVNSVDKYIRATDHIKEIVSQIKRLIKKGYAYEIDDGVYYDISKFKEYGKLSHQNIEELNVQRIEPNPQKRNPGDFSLWKKAKPNEPFWESPFGNGRPGWHIEDTAITEKLLGEQYDLHGGGQDLIFPHHEAEIAQMEAISGKQLVKYWMHNGFININKEKMSKSLGNIFSIRDALKKYDAKVIRYFLFSVHYKAPVDFSDDLLEQAKNSLTRFWEFYDKLKDYRAGKEAAYNESVESLIMQARKKFEEAMDEDFETSRALAALFEFLREINTLIAEKKLNKENVKDIAKFVKEIDSVLCVIIRKEEKIPQEIAELAVQRETARKERNFSESDRLRALIKEKGYWIDDTSEGAKIKKL